MKRNNAEQSEIPLNPCPICKGKVTASYLAKTIIIRCVADDGEYSGCGLRFESTAGSEKGRKD